MKPIKEDTALQSLNTSRVTILNTQPNSKVYLQCLKNEYLMQYPQQPKESCSQDALPFESDSREVSLSKRALTMGKHPILAESAGLASPSIKRRESKIVWKFIEKMKGINSSFTKNAFVRALLLDKIYDGNLELYQTILQSKTLSFKGFSGIQFPLHRYGCFRSTWKIFLQLTYMSIVVFSSLIIMDPQNRNLQQMLLIQLIILVFNCVLNLHTRYYYNDVEVTNLKAIQLNYIKQKGFSDFLMLASLFLILQIDQLNLLIISTLILNICVIHKLKFQCSFINPQTLDLFRKLLQGIIYCHIFSIIHWGINNQGQENQEYLNLLYKYLLNYLMIAADVQYDTTFELLLGIFIEAIFLINRIGLVKQLISNFNKNIDYFQKENDYYLLKNYLKKHKINQQLSQLALHNYKFQIEKEKQQSTTIIHKPLLKYLNFNIQKQIDKIVKTQLFKQINLFRRFSQGTQEKIIDSMQFQKIEANEIILQYNQLDDCCIYLIKKGQVKLCYNRNNNKQVLLKILKESDIFGEVSFLSGIPRTCTIVSLGPVQLYKITRADYLNAIKSNGMDLEIATYLKDQIKFENRFDGIRLKCLCCNSSNHLIHSCKYLTYRPDMERVLSQYVFDHKQERKKIRRSRMRASNSRDNMFQLNLIGEEFQENNFKEDDSKFLKDVGSNNQNQLSFTYAQQQKRISVNKLGSADKIIQNDFEDSRDQFQEIVQMISRKDHLKHSLVNSPLQEIIQEISSSDSNDSIIIQEEKLPQFNFKQNQVDKNEKIQEHYIINANPQRSAHSLTIPNSGDQISRKSKKSATQTKEKHNFIQPKQNLFASYIADEGDKNLTDPESIYRKGNRQNRGDENTHQFYVFSNTVNQIYNQNPQNQEEFTLLDNFEKANNFTHYYPNFNPKYLFYQQFLLIFQRINHQKFNQQKTAKNKYSINTVISDKINSKLFFNSY